MRKYILKFLDELIQWRIQGDLFHSFELRDINTNEVLFYVCTSLSIASGSLIVYTKNDTLYKFQAKQIVLNLDSGNKLHIVYGVLL